MHSGVPGEQSFDVQQDDLILNVSTRLGSSVEQVKCQVVLRLYLPHPDIWENRTGPHFGMRLGVRTTAQKHAKAYFRLELLCRMNLLAWYLGAFSQQNLTWD